MLTRDKLNFMSDPYKRRLFEVSIFLLILVPPMITPLLGQECRWGSFTVTAFVTIFRDIALTGLVVFFLLQNDETIGSIGWKSTGMKREAALGVGLVVPVMIIERLIWMALPHLGLKYVRHPPDFLIAKHPWQFFLACVMVTVAAAAEETIFRGYLISRFHAITGRVVPAVIISTAIFTLGHISYEDSGKLIYVGIMGLILAIVYVWRKSLIAPMVIHLLQDFFPLVLIPLIKLR